MAFGSVAAQLAARAAAAKKKQKGFGPKATARRNAPIGPKKIAKRARKRGL